MICFDFDFTVPPSIHNPGVIHTPSVNENNPLTLSCNASGNPPPVITWFRNRILIPENTTSYQIFDDGTSFHIVSAHVDDATRFTCKVENVAGVEENNFDVNILGLYYSFVVLYF